MLFNSYIYIAVFLPITYCLFRWVRARYPGSVAIALLVVASLVYYGWWNPHYLVLIVGSMAGNFLLGRLIARHAGRHRGRLLTAAGIVANLGALGYYKYAGFVVGSLNEVGITSLTIPEIVLPLAISFFTFQQIAYLLDVYRNEAHEYRALHYALFVTFFPQLIAGPIVHHKEMLPQFARDLTSSWRGDFLVGTTIFFIGLFKKAVLADGIAPHANSAFDMAAAGDGLSFFLAWGGTLSYTFQLYFDFSGYSDMAIGSARLFGIRLPLNFHSPYKALSISEFWRRWHMTLSRFLRDYLYIALGGNRCGPLRRRANLLATMLLGGLWHGAGWNFVVWGGLHGLYLVINHAWATLGIPARLRGRVSQGAYRGFAWLTTFLAVIIGWVFFRASDFSAAIVMLESMIGFHGFGLPNAIVARLGLGADMLRSAGITTFIGGGADFVAMWAWLALLFPIAVLFPNTQEFMRKFDPALIVHPPAPEHALPGPRWTHALVFDLQTRWAVALAVVALLGVLALNQISEFLYYQF